MKSTLPILALLVSPCTVAQIYTATPLPFSIGAANGADVQAGQPMNNAGQVIGTAPNAAGGVDGFLYSNGMPINLGASLIPSAINDSGQIAGTSEAAGSHVAFLYTDGKLTALGTLGSYYEPRHATAITYSFAQGINAGGQVIGRSSSADQGEAPFLYGNGKITGLPIGDRAVAQAINDAGTITGEFLAAPDRYHAFLYRNGAISDLGTLGGAQSAGNAINRANHVTGTAETADRGRRDAFLYAEGAMRDLGSLYGSGSAGYALNNAEQVVGLSRGNLSGAANAGPTAAASQTTATLWTGAKIVDLNAALAHPLPGNEVLVEAIGINDRGSIVANGRAGNKVTAYLLTPVAPITFSCPASTGETGTPYSSALTAGGGVPPYTFSLNGQMPSGIEFNTHTGSVTGTPTAAGVFQLSAQAADSFAGNAGAASINCTITISPAAVQLKIFPERYSFGTVRRFTLLHNTLTLMNTGNRPVAIAKPTLSLGNGTPKGNFAATSVCRSLLAPGKSCRIDVVVFARDEGPLSATIKLPNNAVGSLQEVPLDVTVAPRAH